MTPTEWIEHEVKLAGGRALDPEPSVFKDVMDWSTLIRDRIIQFSKERLFSHENSRLLEVFYSQRSSFGAYARGNDGVDLVCINIGSIQAIYDLFYRVLSHPESFPFIGTPHDEDESRTNIPSLGESGAFHFVMPKCRVRFWFATCLADSAFGFLLIHELAHLKNGHIDWKRGLTSKEKANMEKYNLSQQALEMDADSEAIRWILNIWFEDAYHFFAQQPRTLKDHAVRLFLRSPKDIIYNIYYSSYMIIRLFEKGGWALADQITANHPADPARQRIIATIITTLVEANPAYQCTSAESLELLTRAIRDAEKNFALVKGTAVDASAIKSTFDKDPIFTDYLHNLHLAWSEIQPTLNLLQRSRFKLAPAYGEMEDYKRASPVPEWLSTHASHR